MTCRRKEVGLQDSIREKFNMKTIKILILENLVQRLETLDISEMEFLFLVTQSINGEYNKIEKELRMHDNENREIDF